MKDDGDHSRKHPVSLQNSLLQGETRGDCALLRLRCYSSSCADHSKTAEFPSMCTSEAISTAGDRVLETSIWTKCWRRAVSTSSESFPIALFSVRHLLSPRWSWHIFQAEAFHKQRVLTHGTQDYEILIWWTSESDREQRKVLDKASLETSSVIHLTNILSYALPEKPKSFCDMIFAKTVIWD